MDVRCEKCQTEYELDESRLKPGGVTVKCTNCGHMFKIRKRTPTNVGLPAVTPDPRQRPASSRQPIAQDPPAPRPAPGRADSVLGDASPAAVAEQGSGPTGERQWLVRLENGEQKMCRELSTLQQWIVAGVVSRESLISRSGKTWKRLGDISELHQYFVVADEARGQRAAKPTPKPLAASTMLGLGSGTPSPMQAAAAAGGTILPDDDDRRATGNFRSRPRTAPPPPPKSSGSQPKANPLAQTDLAPSSGPVRSTAPPPIPGGRSTAAWASSDIVASESMAAMPQGPRGGNVSSGPDNEPAFAGRVRIDPSAESSFQTGRVSRTDLDDDDLMPARRGSRAGIWITLFILLAIAGGAGAVYMFVFNKKAETTAAIPKDAAAVAVVADAAAVVPVAVDAAPTAPLDPLDSARTELMAGIEPRMKGVLDSLAGRDDPASLAMRARLATAIAQSVLDRAGLATEKAETDKLRKESKQLVIDAAPVAQRAVKGAADDASANLAMAEVLRLQGKPAKDVQRYLELARAKGASDKELARSIALAHAQLLTRDAKLDEAMRELAALDGAGDNRIGLAVALVAYAQAKPADAKPFVDAILVASPDHDVARALQKRLDTMVAKTDPLPPEDGHGSGSAAVHHDPGTTPSGGGSDYDSLVAKAGKLAETNCVKALDIYAKALEQKVTGVEALTGMGYCFLDAKQFSSAFSKFRTALAVSNRYEPALAGVAETYQQQGNKEQAIEAWKKYLEAYPGSAKAKKQLEILGAPAEGGGAGSAAAGSAATPTPTPTPTPVPTPAPTPAPAAGSGSAS